MRRWCARLRTSLRRERADREMAREIDAHLALLEEDLLSRGLTREQAHLVARRSFGGLDQVRERHRDERSLMWLEQLLQDIRHAGRGLRRSPGFCVVAVLSLAFGIGANTAIFTLVNGVLIRKLPVPEPHRIVQIGARGASPEFSIAAFSFPALRAIRAQKDIFTDIIGFSSTRAVLDIDGDSRSIELDMVTGSYFAFFGARPELGRLLTEEDDRVEGARAVCVISYRAWQSRFGANPAIVGRVIRLDGIPVEVVGVAPDSFVGPELQRRYEVWVPTALKSRMARRSRDSAFDIWLNALGRLAPGLSLASADARIKVASPTIDHALPKDRANSGLTYFIADAGRGFDSWRRTLKEPLAILMGGVSLVLLVACANLANLLLARANQRRQESALKRSLGINRLRLMRQALLETVMVAFGGGALALLLSHLLTRSLLSQFNLGNRYRTLEVSPDATVFAFTLATCVVTALIAGLYPAWRAAQTDAIAGLKGASTGVLSGRYVRRTLIVVQVALAVVLLFGATLFTRSLAKLKAIDLGYDLDHVLALELTLQNKSSRSQQLLETLERVRRLPDVESAAYAWPGVLSPSTTALGGMIRFGPTDSRDFGMVLTRSASPGLFTTLRTPIVRGRDFTPADLGGTSPVVIVNQSFASKAWPGENPIGRRFSVSGDAALEVIGVAADSKYQSIAEVPTPTIYQPFNYQHSVDVALQIRGRGSLGRLEREIRAIVRTSAPDCRISEAAGMETARDRQIAEPRILASLLNLFGALANVLALIGIYGLISYAVARRTREIGVRIAVGAPAGSLVWLFTRESMVLASIGMLLGLPPALLLANLAEKLLYKISTTDPWGIAVTVVVTIVGGILASYLPASRALRIDPMKALRCE